MIVLAFADAAHRLAAEARARGLEVPAFRSPPRDEKARRSVARYAPHGYVVAVAIKDREDEVVLADMVAGVLEVNDRAGDVKLYDALMAAGARPMHPAWARAVRDECVHWSVPFFFKQWGEHAPVDPEPYTRNGSIARPDGTFRHRFGVPPSHGEVALVRVGKKAAGRELDGRTWDEYPDGAA